MTDKYRTREERRRKQNENKKKNKPNRKLLMKRILLTLGITMLIMIIAGGITAYAIIRDAPELDPERLTLAQNPSIYSRDGELITSLEAGENRRLASIDEIPQVLIDAVIAVEDVRFYDHFGIDMRRIGGAVVANITRGFGAEGASTITQQVVKNLFLDPSKNWTRKIQEQYLAIKLEREYSKDQILEMYLNAINFSGNRYGVVWAADYFFSKELSELTIEDAALLAGIPQRPNHFNPYTNPEGAETRRNTVIALMERHGKITPEEAEAARSVSVEDQLNPSETEPFQYQAFIDQVLNEVEAIEGIEMSDIYTSGLKIYTTLDTRLQEHVEYVMQSGEVINFPDEKYQAGITVLDTKTGEVLALGGMRTPAEGVRNWNWAVNPRRQPGSAIKPILDYGPAVDELKWSTYHQILDEPHTYTNSSQQIRNFDRTYRGYVSMREAMRISLNVPAVKAFQAVGIEKVKEFGERLGLNLDTIEEPYAIGGFTRGVSSYQMAGAYAAFGNNGEFIKPHTVTRIEFPDGQVIDLTPEPVIAMNDYTAFMITDIMKTVVQSGTGTNAAVSGVPIAGKTGSTNFTEEERQRYGIENGIKDSWFAGYSTEITAAVWTGYDTPADGWILQDGQQNRIAQHIFREVMTFAHEEREVSDFTRPDSVVRVGIERSTGLLPSDYTPESEIVYEYFVRGTEPSEVSEEFVEAEPVQGLQATYDEENHKILIQWNYPEELRDDFSFRLEVRAGEDGNYSLVDITKDLQYVLTNPDYNTRYFIRVTAISDSNEDLISDPVTVDVRTPEEEEEELIDLPDEIFDDEEDEEEERPGRGRGRGGNDDDDDDGDNEDEDEDDEEDDDAGDNGGESEPEGEDDEDEGENT
ncbi:penicillin-binding protein 1A [Evansella vedderi]|uniref:Penicillin-binding protein 1A n=1 Tax=Evansella vedderi TaxID=38282 RepID=A0ABT9ZWY4_9BACI|nr:penicillin-binding protein 1A [Evansella vedderi]MDQ0255252.1 penicillin-binding protein 1A [Evansella vedderi]